MPVFEDRDDELMHLAACNSDDTPGMDLGRLVQQGLGASAQLWLQQGLRAPALLPARAAGPWSVCAAVAAAGPESACAAAAGSEPFGGSVDSSAEVAHFFHVRVSPSLQ